VRTVLNIKQREHITAASRELYWRPITQRIQYKLCVLVHKMFVGHSLKYITTCWLPSSSSLWTLSYCDVVVQTARRKIGEWTFSVAVPGGPLSPGLENIFLQKLVCFKVFRLLGFYVLMYEDRTQNYDIEIHEEYHIHDTPSPLPRHL